MIAAVTGGTGFVGRALLRRLRESSEFSEIRVLSRRDRSLPGATCFRGDLADPGTPLDAFLQRVDVLFHCAGETLDERAMAAVHVEGTRRLLRAASGIVSRWVQLSSVGVYGPSVRRGIIDESSPIRPQGTYETTKAESDALVRSWPGLSTVTLRPSIVFGPRMPNQSLRQLVNVVRRGLFFFASRKAIANYVYVDDVADALLRCATASHAGGAFNLSDDRPMTQFVETIAVALDVPRPRLQVPEAAARLVAGIFGLVPGFPLTRSRLDALTREVSYPSARIRREIGFAFAVSIEEGLKRFVESLAAPLGPVADRQARD